MFVRHWGPSFALKAFDTRLPLWLPFLAVQLVDIAMVMLALQTTVFFGPPPASTAQLALTALASCLGFAAVARWLEPRRVPVSAERPA